MADVGTPHQLRRTDLTPHQKAAFVLVILLGVGGIFMGFYSFKVSARRPLELQMARARARARALGEYVLPEDQAAREMEAMKTKDTDGDLLVDYDEAYVYKTSPFLADTDSDGFDDKVEVMSGNDPNCPQGKVCTIASAGGSSEAANQEEPDLEGLLPSQIGTPFTNSALGDVPLTNEQDLINYFGTMSPADLRAAMIKTGAPADEVNALTDEQLEELLAKALQESLKTQADGTVSLPTYGTEGE